MGLHIARAIVEAHGGRIWIEDSGPGATFCLCLPLRSPAGQARPEREAGPAAGAPADSGASR
ncbi:MAG TPA: ATP-binding protein [Chloroflexota bacterium]